MSRLDLHRYLSVGYSFSEQDEADVGRHGVGGKAGMMKLGSDALVISRCNGKHIVGLLSVTMHELEELDEIRIPMVEHEVVDGEMQLVDEERDAFSQKTILRYVQMCFGFKTWEELLAEFNDMYNPEHGTKLMVALSDETKASLRLNRPDHDIEVYNLDRSEHYAHEFSLRAKMQILYQEESPGSCAALFIDKDKVELTTRDDLFDSMDRNRLHPKNGSPAELKLPLDVFFPDYDLEKDGDPPTIKYYIGFIDEACGQKITQASPENLH